MKRVMRIEKNIKCVFIDAHIPCAWFLFGGCVGSVYGASVSGRPRVWLDRKLCLGKEGL